MFLRLFATIVFLGSFVALAGEPEMKLRVGQVDKIIDHQTVEISISGKAKMATVEEGDAVLFKTEDGEAIGYGRILDVQGKTARVKILFREHHKLVLVGDFVLKPDYSARNPEFEGRHDLLTRGKVHSYFKPLAHLGPVIGPAHVLDRNEIMLDLTGFFQYGLTKDVTISTQAIYALLGTYSIDVRAEVLDTEEFILTPGIAFAFSPSTNEKAYLFRGLLSSKSYSKLRSYTMATIALKPGGGFQNAIEQSELVGGYEFIFDNWNRFLAGPSYNIDEQAIGGFFSYVWIYQNVHLLLGAKSANLFAFKFGPKGYLPNLGLMYRF